ncbi:hypothetical protein ACR82Z_00590 [Mycoplasma sp. 6243]|uniref:hypothetical protein n=1 Tax=Mycoplasma sp. 6243 TaxID=3440865 RepID=UPI003EBE5E02
MSWTVYVNAKLSSIELSNNASEYFLTFKRYVPASAVVYSNISSFDLTDVILFTTDQFPLLSFSL